jgi:medium-chain acyl-CoA synthetase
MTDAYSEARASFTLPIPDNPNFVTHIFDKYAADPSLQAMLWVSADKPAPSVKSLSYAYFAERSHRVACALRNLGLRKGDRVLLMLPRIPAWWELALGMLRLGVVLVPSTMLLVSKDIEYRLEASGARAFIGTVDSASHFIQCRKFPASLEFTILVEDYYSSHPLPESRHTWTTYSELLSSVPERSKWKGTIFSPNDPSIIYFTSGTTGMPKMVQHTQISYPFGCVVTGKYWLKLRPGKIYWNMSEQGWAKAAWSFFAAFVTLFLKSVDIFRIVGLLYLSQIFVEPFQPRTRFNIFMTIPSQHFARLQQHTDLLFFLNPPEISKHFHQSV